MDFVPYKENGRVKSFTANTDRHSVVCHRFKKRIAAMFVRVHPKSWYSWISMRIEFKGCSDKCDVPLGIQDGRITQSMFTASSMANRYYGPWSARLQARNHGAFRGGWVARVSNNRQWLQVDLGAKCVLKRIATQARYDGNHWITKYTLSYSSNGVRFYPYKEKNKIRVFLGNQERYFVVTNRFLRPFTARYVRLNVVSWYGFVATRMELYGCVLGRRCNQPMGLQNGRLRNHLITASSQIDKYSGAYMARLNHRRRGRYMGGWTALYNNRYQFLQLNFGAPAKIIRIATQGREDQDQWVTTYYIMSSRDGVRFVEYKERNNRRYFAGNRDRNTAVMYPFNPPIRCQYLRVVPWSWRTRISMRVEAYGCYTGKKRSQ
ncbi:PREDICTED: coagulation factor V-like [Acropora digitifera]|uniref:coagulation factor V-like n=1 Tax=Acropora digitifera TaxID=70779 RepID=UPI00077A3677|nr:PREDICTED: coagulation factor V-like [Acropora digitifera]